MSAAQAGVKPDRVRKPRGPKRFSQKAKYTDAKSNSLTVSIRQVDENGTDQFRVSVSHQKADTQKRLRGMVDVYPTKDAAVKRYDEIVAMATKAKWTPAPTSSGRSTFDTLPLPA
jgi:hypothetical protein